MSSIVLYGTGKRGKKMAGFLTEKGISVAGFLDSNKKEKIIKCREEEMPILSLNDVKKYDYQIIITIADYNEALKVKKQLNGLKVVTVEEVINDNVDNIVEKNRDYIMDYHNTKMEDYYIEAESESSMNIFWNKDSSFYEMFSALDLDNVIELVCGHGRHVTQYKKNANKITLVDILDKNIEYCKKRFSEETKIKYYVNNGYDLSKLESDAYSAVFSSDAMVHFEMLDIFEYLKEIKRVLKTGGRGLFHHSNNTEDYKVTFSTGTRGRNYMSAQIFAYLANRAGLTVIKQRIIDWAQIKI